MPTNVALTGLAKDLAARGETGKPIRIGLVGAGEMGTDIVSRVAHMQGIAIGAISELKPGAARRSVEIAYGNEINVAEVSTADAANAAMEQGRIALTDNVHALLEAGLIDVVVDATGIPSVGAEIGLAGSDDLVVKVSADGAVWTEALKVLAAGGAASVLAGFQIGGQTAYHRGNLLGAVSQSAGIPSGGVIERGSNANGEYVRFADGTQICQQSAATFSYADADHLAFTWTYPAAFVTGSVPIRQVAVSNSNADLTGITIQQIGGLRLGAGVISAAHRLYRAQGAASFASGNQIANCGLMAIGRWA